MDISVSHLNNRLALQLPQELPLGLVFVTGKVDYVTKQAVNENGRHQSAHRVWFDLVEEDFRLRCMLSQRASVEIELSEGDEIRAGGHLAFDPQQAHYYLLARDVEVIEELAAELEIEAVEEEAETVPVVEEKLAEAPSGRRALTPVLADIKRRAESTKLAEADVPYWVQRLAPPEIQAEVAGGGEGQTAVSGASGGKQADDKLMAFLNMAIDSDEEIELTSEMVATLAPKTVTEEQKEADSVAQAYDVPAPASDDAVDEAEEIVESVPEDEADEETDRLIIMLIVVFIILIVVILGALGVYFLS